MYLSHFGLREPPFSITPDPRFLYMSARHREALAHLVYGVGEHGGFVQLTGEVGTGKTSVCRCLLEQLPSHVDLALVLNPRLSPGRAPRRSCATSCESRTRPAPASAEELVDRLYRHLLDAHAPRPAHGPHHRRGAEPRARGARRGAAPHEPRDGPGEAPPGDPDRPAGAGGDPRAAEASPARPAGHGSVPSRAALAGGDARVRPPSPGGGGARPAPVFTEAALRAAAPAVARHSRASSTPSPTGPSWAPTRGSAPGSTRATVRRAAAEVLGRLRAAGGGGGGAGPPRRRSSRCIGGAALVLLRPGRARPGARPGSRAWRRGPPARRWPVWPRGQRARDGRGRGASGSAGAPRAAASRGGPP